MVNQGMPAPIDIQVSGNRSEARLTRSRSEIAAQARAASGVSDVLIPQDLDYPGLRWTSIASSASLVGLSPKESSITSSLR